MSILTAWRREAPAPKVGRHSTVGVIASLRAELDEARQQLARYVGLTRCGCPAGRHGEYWIRAPRPVPCPWCEVGRQLARVAEAQATIGRLRGADPLLVPAPADEGAREEAAAEATAPWDMSELRAEVEDGPWVHALLPADDDTVTLPVPATPPAPEVHDADEPTRPVASPAALRMATPVTPIRTLANAHGGGDAA